jgi:iron complex outermembrane receptor protein
MSRFSLTVRVSLMLFASSAACTMSIAGGTDAAPTASSPASADPTPPATGTNVGINEIVVTAQKWSQSIDTVGMAITALTGDQLKMQGVADVAGLSKIEPSFVVARSNWGSPVYSIRGIGYNDFSLAASPTVSVYQDEVPYAYPDMSKGATFDLERVEILKGPQGTLYGQNATGGAVNYIAARPTDTFQSGIEGTFARFNAVNVNGFVSGPLTGTLDARLSFNVDEGGAWQRSYTRDDRLGNRDNRYARLLLAWTPTDELKVFLNINGWTDNSEIQAAQFVAAVLTDPDFAAFVPQEVNAPVSPNNPRAADWLAGTHPANDERYYQGSVRAEYTVSDHLLLTYLGSYASYRQNDLQEPDGVNNQLYLLQGGSVHSDSQELRASGKLLDQKIIWLVGGNYTRSITDENQYEEILGTTTAFKLEPFLMALHEPALPFPAIRNVSTDDSVSKAAFANVEYHPITQLGFHAGARYTQTDIKHGGCSEDVGGRVAPGATALEIILKRGVGVIPAVPGGCATFGPDLTPGYFTAALNQNNVSWRVGADWTPIEKTLLYTSVSRGYKAGSFPTLAATSYLSLKPATQESLLAYEIGFKSRFLENRVAFEGDVFYYDYHDKQLEMRKPDPQGIFGLLNRLVNVPKSEVTGAELAVKLMPAPHLVLTFRGTYLDSKVISSFLGYNSFSSTPINLQGEAFPNTPKWSISGDAQYSWDINGHYSAFVGIDGRYRTSSQGEFGTYNAIQEGYPSLVVKAYAIADVRAGLLSRNGHWRLEAFGNNVTNTYYWTQASLSGESVVRFAGMPATYGVTVGYNY